MLPTRSLPVTRLDDATDVPLSAATVTSLGHAAAAGRRGVTGGTVTVIGVYEPGSVITKLSRSRCRGAQAATSGSRKPGPTSEEHRPERRPGDFAGHAGGQAGTLSGRKR